MPSRCGGLLPRRSPGPWKRLLAQLTFDSGGLGQPALGLRGEAPVRQWLFTCEDHDVDLRGQAMDAGDPDSWRLHGQVLGPEGSGEALLFAAGEQESAVAEPLRRTGWVRWPTSPSTAWPRASYRVVLLLGPLRVELPGIQFGDTPTAPA